MNTWSDDTCNKTNIHTYFSAALSSASSSDSDSSLEDDEAELSSDSLHSESSSDSSSVQIKKIILTQQTKMKHNILSPYSVGLEIWSKLAKQACIKCIASKFVRDFECDLQRLKMFSHCVTLTHVLLPQIISCSDTKVKCWLLLLLWNVSVQVWFMYPNWYFYSILQGQEYTLKVHGLISQNGVFYLYDCSSP